MITVRRAGPADVDAIAAIHTNAWRTSYSHLMPAEFIESRSIESRRELWAKLLAEADAGDLSNTPLVAVDAANTPVGFVRGGDPRAYEFEGYDCELHAIYIDLSDRTRGVGSALTLELARWLNEKGCKRMYIWALEKNSACRFYEKMGGVRLPKTRNGDYGGTILVEVAYGYEVPALLALLEARAAKV